MGDCVNYSCAVHMCVLLHVSDLQQIKWYFLSNKLIQPYTLAFFDRNLRCTLSLRPCPQKRSTAGAAQRSESSIAGLTVYQLFRFYFMRVVIDNPRGVRTTAHMTHHTVKLELNPTIPRMP